MEEITWRWILINKESGKYYDNHNSEATPRNGDPDKIEWIEWNKPLPEDVGFISYVYDFEIKELKVV